MIRRTAEFYAGMPNLSLAGLSENWLLKECGHQHWLALARLMGQAQPDFRNAAGDPVYAAFVCVALRDARLQLINENDALVMDTCLCPAGKARFFSRHRLSGPAGAFCEIEMISTLVSRREAGNNQSVARSDILRHADSSAPEPDSSSVALATAADSMMQSYRQFRGLQEGRQPDFTLLTDWQPTPGVLAESQFAPCPHSDFNGADFLYFANFQQFVDRAEWQQQTSAGSQDWLWQTSQRQLNYYGNINPGDQLRVMLCARQQDNQQLRHWQRIYRLSDGRCIADIVTLKQALDSSGYRRAMTSADAPGKQSASTLIRVMKNG
ncbi:Pnap_2097 family protein [Oceanobacter mangrovi]|uniref:Pnap_2097 family protein n=1 Tax=Oceanobacter mangrovi TaxID=2862510 RepID=UPI001C8E4F20|nr:Pnap_2097 family protein [Oceanobacter mangrovi]